MSTLDLSNHGYSFAGVLEQYRGNILHVNSNTHYTHGDLKRSIEQTRQHLQGSGVSVHDQVALVLSSGIQFISVLQDLPWE